MKQLENFVKNTFKNYPNEDRQALIDNITEMLKEKVEDLMSTGLTEQEAIDKAVLEFGTLEDYEDNPKKVNRKLKRQRTLKQYKYDIFFSFGGSLIIIGILMFTDLHYTEGVIWFVIPALMVLWWPLATIYRYLLKKESIKEESDE